MKKTIVLVVVLFACLQIGSAQKNEFKFGLRAGLSTTEINADEITISQQGAQDLGLAIQDANYGIHAGLFAKIPLGMFFLQPEVLFNSNSVDFRVDEVNANDVQQVFEEKYQNLDIPVIFGVKLGPLRPQIGLVGHVFLNSSEGLKEAFTTYRPEFDDFTFGWQGGLGLELGRVLIDLKYEGNFNDFGNHIIIGDTQYNFDESPSRFIATVGFAF